MNDDTTSKEALCPTFGAIAILALTVLLAAACGSSASGGAAVSAEDLAAEISDDIANEAAEQELEELEAKLSQRVGLPSEEDLAALELAAKEINYELFVASGLDRPNVPSTHEATDCLLLDVDELAENVRGSDAEEFVNSTLGAAETDNRMDRTGGWEYALLSCTWGELSVSVFTDTIDNVEDLARNAPIQENLSVDYSDENPVIGYVRSIDEPESISRVVYVSDDIRFDVFSFAGIPDEHVARLTLEAALAAAVTKADPFKADVPSQPPIDSTSIKAALRDLATNGFRLEDRNELTNISQRSYQNCQWLTAETATAFTRLLDPDDTADHDGGDLISEDGVTSGVSCRFSTSAGAELSISVSPTSFDSIAEWTQVADRFPDESPRTLDSSFVAAGLPDDATYIAITDVGSGPLSEVGVLSDEIDFTVSVFNPREDVRADPEEMAPLLARAYAEVVQNLTGQ